MLNRYFKGMIKRRRVIKNVFFAALSLCLCGFIFSEKLVELREAQMPNDINTMGDRLYITKRPTFYIYSLKD